VHGTVAQARVVPEAMGVGMSCLASAAASCAATLACQGMQCLGGGVAKASARVAYCGLFFLSMLLCWILRDYAKPMLEKLPWIIRGEVESELSDVWYSQQAVYRVSLGNFLFFAGLSCVLIDVKTRGDRRCAIHHDHWAIKVGVWVLLTVLPFFLPNDVIKAYEWAARVGSGVFLVIQMVILLDFTAAWNASWVQKESESWLYALLAVTLTCVGGALTLVGLLFHWYRPHAGCALNTTLITVTLLLILVLTAVAVHPAIKGGSIMPSSVISAYVAYLAMSALSSEPAGYECNGPASQHGLSEGSVTIGMVLTLLSVVYSALRAGSNTSFFMVEDDEEVAAVSSAYTALAAPGDPAASDEELEPEESEDGSPRTRQRNKGPVPYNYAFFHLIFAMAAMYTAMLMTGWGEGQGEGQVDVGWASVWVKIASQWATAGLYLWTMMAPVLLPDRDFGW